MSGRQTVTAFAKDDAALKDEERRKAKMRHKQATTQRERVEKEMQKELALIEEMERKLKKKNVSPVHKHGNRHEHEHAQGEVKDSGLGQDIFPVPSFAPDSDGECSDDGDSINDDDDDNDDLMIMSDAEMKEEMQRIKDLEKRLASKKRDNKSQLGVQAAESRVPSGGADNEGNDVGKERLGALKWGFADEDGVEEAGGEDLTSYSLADLCAEEGANDTGAFGVHMSDEDDEGRYGDSGGLNGEAIDFFEEAATMIQAAYRGGAGRQRAGIRRRREAERQEQQSAASAIQGAERQRQRRMARQKGEDAGHQSSPGSQNNKRSEGLRANMRRERDEAIAQLRGNRRAAATEAQEKQAVAGDEKQQAQQQTPNEQQRQAVSVTEPPISASSSVASDSSQKDSTGDRSVPEEAGGILDEAGGCLLVALSGLNSDQVAQWAEANGLPMATAHSLRSNGVDGAMLCDPELKEDDLREVGVAARMHRRRLMTLIVEAKQNILECSQEYDDEDSEDDTQEFPDDFEPPGLRDSLSLLLI